MNDKISNSLTQFSTNLNVNSQPTNSPNSSSYSQINSNINVETIDFQVNNKQNITNDELKNIGYEYYLNGCELPNIEWDFEKLLFWEKGMDSAKVELHNVWKDIGYKFVTEGTMLTSMDTKYYRSDAQRLTIITDGLQLGIEKALSEGKVIDPNNIPPLTIPFDEASEEQKILEIFRRLLSEGWYNIGINSINDIGIFTRINPSSIYDEFFSIRNIPISASKLINAGRRSVLNNNSNNN